MKANRDQKAVRRKPLANTPQEKMEQERQADAENGQESSVQDAAVPHVVDAVDGEVEALE